MKVYIDAGHNYNGVDTGAAGFGIREQGILKLKIKTKGVSRQ